MPNSTVSSNTKPSSDDLKRVITEIDSYSQQGFSKIEAIARIAIIASESPYQNQNMLIDIIIMLLHTIQGIASDIQNCINCEAENVDCNYTKDALL